MYWSCKKHENRSVRVFLSQGSGGHKGKGGRGGRGSERKPIPEAKQRQFFSQKKKQRHLKKHMENVGVFFLTDFLGFWGPTPIWGS